MASKVETFYCLVLKILFDKIHDIVQCWSVYICRAFLYNGFLSDKECDHLINLVSKIPYFDSLFIKLCFYVLILID